MMLGKALNLTEKKNSKAELDTRAGIVGLNFTLRA